MIVVQALGIAVVALLYAALCVGVLLFVSVPAALILGAVAAVGSALGSWVLIAVDLADPERDRDLPADRASAPHVLEAGPGVDPAWRDYLAAQAALDATAAADRVREVGGAVWRGLDRRTRAVLDERWPLLWPLAPVPYAIGLAAGAGAVAAVVVAAVVVGVPAGTWWLVRAVAVRVQSARNRARLRRAGAAATCTAPGCDEVTDLPVVDCRCGRHHHQMRPGPFGVLRRRCTCGALLPATAAAAAEASFVLRCPRCGRRLLPGALRGTDVRIAVLGPPGAGSTSVATAGLAALAAAVRAADGGVAVLSPVDGPGEPDRNVRTCTSVRLATGRNQGTVHVYDVPGAVHADRDQHRRLFHLPHAHGIAYVIDPTTLPRIAGRVDRPGPPAGVDPEPGYRALVQYLHEQRVPLRERALAVVLTRADELAVLFPGRGPRAGSDGVRDWLSSMGLDNLVLATGRDFGRVRFFAVAAPRGDSVTAGLALHWLVGRAGLRLPAPAAPAPTSAGAP